jgi:hypothetical protein
MRKINEFLKDAAKEFPDALAGKSSAGGFDGPPLPVNLEYRVVLTRGEWRQANNSGNYSFAMTFEVAEPAEFAGRKFSEYYSIDEGAHPVAREKFAQLIGASCIDLTEVNTDDNDEFAKAFEGTQYVVATRVWGDDGDRNGIRYLNKDYGQTLKTDVKPPKPRGGGLPTRKGPGIGDKLALPTAQILKNTEEEAQAEQPAAPSPTLPGGAAPSGVKLPPGLGGRP